MVDPQRDVDEYVEDARRLRCRIGHVFLTGIDLDPRLRPDKRRAAPARGVERRHALLGNVGRPDLRASLGWSAEQLGSLLHDSLHEKLLTLPDDVLVYPAHGAGSLCGKNLSTDTVSTIGVQRRYNYACVVDSPVGERGCAFSA